MSTIPFSQVVSVVPSVLSAGGQAVDLNGLFLTQSSYAPYGQVLQFSDAAGVQSYFGSTSTEATLASIYFNGYSIGTQLPGSLLFARYPETAIAGTLQGGSLASVTLGQLQAFTGTLAITAAGVLKTSGTINLTGATSFSNAATIIQAAFTTPGFTVAFDSVHSAFIFTTSTTGATQTISYAATGTLATQLLLTQAAGAIISQGAAIAVPATFMDTILTQNQNWATFMTVWESSLTEKQAFANWSNSNAPRWLYVAQDSDANALIAGSTNTFGNYLQSLDLVGTCAIYGTNTLAAFVCGFAASLNFTRLNGRATLCFKMQSGLVPAVTDSTAYAAVLSNGYNTYAAFGSNNPANNENWFTPGSVSGEWLWADTYLNQIWLNANLQLAMVNLLLQVGAIPYNSQGNGLIYAAALDPINAAINFGAIRAGINVSAAQAAEIQYALGFNAAPTIAAQGFYLQISPATAQTRAARQSPPITLYYQDGEAVQQITMASIAIQ
jgi:Protein of unknown function (DUF3383)